LKEKVILKYTFSEMESTDTGYYYRDIGLSDITKSQLLEKYTVNNIIYISFVIFMVTVLYAFVGYIVLELIYTMLLAMIGYIVSRIFRIPLKFIAVIHLAVYSMTLPILLNAVYIIINMFTGFEIEYFTVMCMAISYIYMITAILLIKSDFIKRNIELTAIIEEQQKVKEEMEKKRQEEELEKHREEKKKEREEKRKKEEDNGKEKGENPPEGSKA
jgi:signal transduction histidine kinase